MIIHNPDQHLVIKIGLLIHLYFTRSHELLRKSYESLYTNEVRVRGKARFDYRRIITNFINGKGLREEVDLSKIVGSERARIDNFCENGEEKEKSYARTGLTGQYPLWIFYDIFSNVIFCYVFAKTLIPFEMIGTLLFNRKLIKKCILPGKFVVLYDSMSDQFNLSLAAFHLGWRLYQWKKQRKFRLQLIMFMIQSDKEIGRILNLYGREFSKSIDPSGSDYNEDSKNEEERVSTNSIEVKQSVMKKNPTQQMVKKSDGAFQCYDDFLIYLMYYQVKYETKITYKLRPNRTSEARHQLTKLIIRFYYISFLIFSLLFIVIFPVAFYIILSDIFYVQSYPGCYDYLEKLYLEGKLTYLSVTLWGPKLYANLFDFYVNFCTWIDSGIAVVFVIPVAYILNYDLLLYWKHFQVKLENVLYELKLDSIMTNQFCGSNLKSSNVKRKNEKMFFHDYRDFDMHSHHSDLIGIRNREIVESFSELRHDYCTSKTKGFSSIFKGEKGEKTSSSSQRGVDKLNERVFEEYRNENDNHHHHDSVSNNQITIDDCFKKTNFVNDYTKSSDFSSEIQLVTNRVSSRKYYLENLIYVLQAELRDFFKQIEEANKIVSDVLSAAFIIWFFEFVLITYSSLTTTGTDNFVGLRSAQAIGLAAISITSIVLLSLVHHTNKSYETICSIMAYDRSKYKKKFLKIIEFYTKRNCSSYTLFHSIPFLATTYLTAMAWNFSCFTIVENLLSSRN